MEQGKIIKGIAGFYYVHIAGGGIYECRAKGLFRKRDIKPVVGDDVHIDVISRDDMTGNVITIIPRRNALARPPVANVDQALVIFALTAPKPDYNLLDRFLVMMEQQRIPSVICMNKSDLASAEDIANVRSAYAASGYPLFFFSAETGDGLERLGEQLRGKTSAAAGPSGSGKSTLINRFAPHARMETAEISPKIQRGRHTTRHSELIEVDEQTFLFDTPGFGSLSVDCYNSSAQRNMGGDVLTVDTDTLTRFFPEFSPYADGCRFRGCSHLSEPGCAVRAAVEAGQVSRSRYDAYRRIYGDLKNKKTYERRSQ